MLIDTFTGSENFPGMIAKVHAFVTPTRAFPGQQEVHIHSAAKDGLHGIRKQTGGGRIMAGEGMSDMMGWFAQSQYDIPEGVVLKLFAMKRIGTNEMVVGCQFVRLRAGAALHKLEVALTGHHKATCRNAYIEGRFDLLTLEQAEAMGVRVMPQNRRQFLPQLVSRIVRDRVMSPEIAAAPAVVKRTIQNSSGEAVVVENRASRRMLDV